MATARAMAPRDPSPRPSLSLRVSPNRRVNPSPRASPTHPARRRRRPKRLLPEVLGPAAIDRDKLARSVRWRGPMEQEWLSYGPDTQSIATSFTSGINAYIRSLDGKRPLEFKIGGYDPGLWAPEDCLARVAGLLMTRNLLKEVERVQDVKSFGLATVSKLLPPDPVVPLTIPN